MEDKVKIISTEEELKVFSDPFRLQIITAYRDSDVPLTVKGCADVLNEVPAKVHYHVKKLLKHDILVLDHIEIINGINAKYYKLPYDNFTIKMKSAEHDNKYNNNKHMTNLVVSILEQFKTTFIQTTQEAVKQDQQDPTEVGTMASSEVYLSAEEYKEFEDAMYKLIEDFKTKDPDKKKYTFIMGISRKK